MSNVTDLQTPRVSGPNGDVHTKEFFIARSVKLVQAEELLGGQSTGGFTRKANNEFLEHDCKPQTKLKLVLLEEAVAKQCNIVSTEIERQLIDEAHKAMESAPDDQQDVNSSSGVPEKIAAKEAQIGVGNKKEGEASDRELQEQRKQERIVAHEERRRQRELKEQKKLIRKEKVEKKQKKLKEKEQQRLARESEKKAEEVKLAEKRRKDTYLILRFLS